MTHSRALADLPRCLREARETLGLSLRAAAQQIGVPRSTLHMLEKRLPLQHLVTVMEWLERNGRLDT